MRNIIALVLTVFLFACGGKNAKYKDAPKIQQNQSETSLVDYIKKPEDQDSTCVQDIEKAKADVAKGKIVFCYPMGFGTHDLRQEKQLIELCKKHSLIFDYELFSDVI